MLLLAFWKKKKAEEKPKIKPAERREAAVYLGEVLVEVKEREEGKIVEGGIDLDKSERTITVTNRSSIPVFSTEILLKNYENTNLESRLFIHRLEEQGKDGSIHKIGYDVKEYVPPIIVSYSLEFPPGANQALWHDTDNKLSFIVEIQSNLDTPIDEVELEYLPSESISSLNVEEPSLGDASSYTDRAVWIIKDLQPRQKASLRINITARPREREKTELGKIGIRVKLEGKTFSSINIEKAISRFLLNYQVIRDECPDESGFWDITINILNPYELELQAEGEVEIVGAEVIEGAQLQAATIEGNKIVLSGATIGPGSSTSIGPLRVKSMDVPQLRIRIGGSVEEKVLMDSEGYYVLELPSVDVAAFELKRTIDVVIDERMKRYVEENEIPSLGDNYIESVSTITNTGGVDIGYVKVSELIPRGLGLEGDIKISIDGKNIKTYEKKMEETEDGTNLIIVLSGDKILPKNKTLTIKYRMTPTKITRDIVELSFPLEAQCSVSLEAEGYKKELPYDETPLIKVRHIIRKVSVSKTVTPTGGDNFELKISIENNSDAPIIDYESKQFIPDNFEILETNPTASVREVENGKIVEWKIDIEPFSSKILTIRVKGVGQYCIDDLIQAETI